MVVAAGGGGGGDRRHGGGDNRRSGAQPQRRDFAPRQMESGSTGAANPLAAQLAKLNLRKN